MRVLVTGGAGYIGSHTLLQLLQNHHEVMVIDNLSNSKAETFEKIGTLSNRNFKFIQSDVLDQQALIDVFEEFKPQGVIHFAGLKSVAESVALPLLYYDVNVVGTLNVLKAMAHIDCNFIVFSSSATVYGTASKPPYTEQHDTAPVNPYGQTKLTAETLIKNWSDASAERKAVSFRYFNPVGAHGSGLLGEDPKEAPNNLMPILLQVAAGKLDKLSIFGNDFPTADGTAIRDYLHVEDLAQAHVLALEKISVLDKFQILNLGTGRGTSVFELVTLFERENNLQIPFKITSRRDGDAAESWADPSLALQVLAWSAKKSLAEMCRDSWHWQITNHPR